MNFHKEIICCGNELIKASLGQTFSLCPSNLNRVSANILGGHTEGIKDTS